MTLHELKEKIDQLLVAGVSGETLVQTEGCDCIGDAKDVRLVPDHDDTQVVLITR